MRLRPRRCRGYDLRARKLFLAIVTDGDELYGDSFSFEVFDPVDARVAFAFDDGKPGVVEGVREVHALLALFRFRKARRAHVDRSGEERGENCTQRT